MTLSCDPFIYEPLTNTTQIDIVLKAVVNIYIDPQKRNIPLPHYNMAWREPTGDDFCAVLMVMAPWDGGRPPTLTGGNLLNAVIGINRIRLAYPKLNFACSMFDDGKEPWVYIGQVELLYKRPLPEIVDDVTAALKVAYAGKMRW
ncbi:MAG: hypothetical protein Q9166_004269 [cf. Caloplaca sp. 2 TL-2023]